MLTLPNRLVLFADSSRIAREKRAVRAICGDSVRGLYTPNYGQSISDAFDGWRDAFGILPDITASGTTRPAYDAVNREIFGDGIDDIAKTADSSISGSIIDASQPVTIYSLIRWNDGASSLSSALALNSIGSTAGSRNIQFRATAANIVNFRIQATVGAYSGNPASSGAIRRFQYAGCSGGAVGFGRMTARAEVTNVPASPSTGTWTLQLCSFGGLNLSVSAIRSFLIVQADRDATVWARLQSEWAGVFHPYVDF